MSITPKASRILLGRPPKSSATKGGLLAATAKAAGVGPFRLMMDVRKLRKEPNKMDFPAYVADRLYRSDLTADDRKSFVSARGSAAINFKMSPLEATFKRDFLRDKVTYTQLIKSLGFPTTETQAYVSKTRNLGNFPVLRSAEAVENFLRNDAKYPIFGKPNYGYGSHGSALLTGCSGDTVTLGNGREANISDLADEICRDFEKGYLFQSAIVQHPGLRKIAGNAIATLRVVTVIEQHDPSLLYALWKIPSPKAMSDNFWQDGNMLARLDVTSGQTTACVCGTGFEHSQMDTHPSNDAPLIGVQLPYWSEVQDLVVRAHALYPEFGVIGWDIALTDQGPLIVEANDNPDHTLYQHVSGMGILGKELGPKIQRVMARGNSVLMKERQFYQKIAKGDDT